MTEESLAEETPIWRYVDLDRFVTMLVSGALRFTKAANFGDDPWEGFCNVMVPSTQMPEAGLNGTIRLESSEQILKSLADSSRKYLEDARHHLYVNSWSLCVDSMAMWKIYGSKGRGLAIQSSIGRCKAALRFNVPSDHYQFGPVDYIDEITASPRVLEDFTTVVPLPGSELRKRITSKAFLKRSAYKYEEEWRGALYQDRRPDVTGVDIACEFETLIESVLVGPNAPDFILGVIEDLMSRFGIVKAVLR